MTTFEARYAGRCGSCYEHISAGDLCTFRLGVVVHSDCADGQPAEAWAEANRRDIPEGLLIRHKCDNPPCIKPDHLELGTHADNQADKVQRGRSLRGSANPGARLSEAQVRAIKARLHEGQAQVTIAAAFGVGTSTISRIRCGKSWGQI